VIETERLLLRKPTVTDASPLGETPERIAGWLSEWESNGLGYFAVLHGGETVGRVGFHVFDDRTWSLTTFDDGGEHAALELGWTIVPEQRGRGFATEAARAAREWAERNDLISLIDPANVPSQRVAERLGCTPGETVALANGETHVVWTHPR
jgi:RimJ/RimL family protein N-acetyltransferase